ncbi:MAG: ATP-binding protein [Methylococcales bacterium]|jgi:uncharacterized protein|nr:ATP-binding protein [Methylococcales bacterium]
MLKEILIEQNPHWSGTKNISIVRDQLHKIIDYLPLKQIITISGIRRCGKSTLAWQAINYLIDQQILANNILFVNLEQPYFIDHKHNTNYLNTIYDEYLKMMNPQGRVYVIFDEIQFFQNWQVFIKSKYENQSIKFIITGSNSSLLSNDLNTLLSGRSLNVHLDTFSFTEFLRSQEIEYDNEVERIKNRIAIARAKEEYLEWGGFYEVFSVTQPSLKREILISYVKNIIYQDIVPRHHIRNSEVLERLFYYLISNITGILNYTQLAKTFEVSDKTIKEYIGYFEDVFMLKKIDKFHTKEKVQIKSSKKIFSLDNGLLQISIKHSKNSGILLENLTYIFLNQQYKKINYYREKYEIDFICQDDSFSGYRLIQVSYDISHEKTRKREINSFKYFDLGKANKKQIITLDTNEIINDIEVKSFDQLIWAK